MTRAAGDSKKHHCPYHPGVPADTPCARCGRLFCPDCVRDWNGNPLGPLCRKARVRRRIIIGAIVAAMLAAPAVVIVWGFDQHRRYGDQRHRIRQRQKLLQRFPKATGVRLRLARDLIRAGRHAEARAELDRLLKRHPKHLSGLLTRGALATAEGDHEGALRYAVRGLAVTPRSRAARLAVARAHLTLGRRDKAEATLRAGLKLDPRSADLALELAAILTRDKRTQEARQVLQRSLGRAASHSDRRRINRALKRLGPPGPAPGR